MKTKKAIMIMSIIFMMSSLAGCGSEKAAVEEIDNSTVSEKEEATDSEEKDEKEETEETGQYDAPIGPPVLGDNQDSSEESEEQEDAGDMDMDEIFDRLEGVWTSPDKIFKVTFYSDPHSEEYFARVIESDVEHFDSTVKYIDAAPDEDGFSIRFVTGNGAFGNCRELILSNDGETVSYLIDRQKGADDKVEEIYSVCYKA